MSVHSAFRAQRAASFKQMPNYKRAISPARTYFFTAVTYNRIPWFKLDIARTALRDSIKKVRLKQPFTIEAWVLMPDHMHCIWTMPHGDQDYSTRWRLIKTFTTRRIVDFSESGDGISGMTEQSNGALASRVKRGEKNIWQRRFWEHAIRDEKDLKAHLDYIHYNPVKHGLTKSPAAWPYTTFHKFVSEHKYEKEWGTFKEPEISGVTIYE